MFIYSTQQNPSFPTAFSRHIFTGFTHFPQPFSKHLTPPQNHNYTEVLCFSRCFSVLFRYSVVILTNSSEDLAVHAKCDSNSSLANSTRARVDEHTFSILQAATYHKGIVCSSIHHWHRCCLLQGPVNRTGLVCKHMKEKDRRTCKPNLHIYIIYIAIIVHQ